MLECPFCWLVWWSGSLWCGLLAWPWLRGWDGAVPTWSRSECIACAQISGVCSPCAPLLPLCHPKWEGCKGVGKGPRVVVIDGAASPGAYQPLTDLGKCPSGDRAQGTRHSCAALAPVRVGWHRAPGDTAAQGRGRGPQLGARWRRSPSAGLPGLDTVYASFCREYLNACSSTRKMHQR